MSKKSANVKEDLKEKCPRCGSLEFSIESGPHQKRYCSECNNVWVPLNRTEIELQYVKEALAQLQMKYDILQKENQKLKSEKELFE